MLRSSSIDSVIDHYISSVFKIRCNNSALYGLSLESYTSVRKTNARRKGIQKRLTRASPSSQGSRQEKTEKTFVCFFWM